jgi:TonB family protein
MQEAKTWGSVAGWVLALFFSATTEIWAQTEPVRPQHLSEMPVAPDTVGLPEPDPILQIAEEMPYQPGCKSLSESERQTCTQNELMRFISSQMRYPEEAKEMGIEGRIYLRFVVSKEGKVTQVRVLRGVHPLLEAEALRVVSALPDFVPGRMQGKPVNVEYTLPILFKLS